MFDTDPEPLCVFAVGGEYLFAEYLDGGTLFDDLREHYDESASRFEVPAEAFETVRDRLEEAYYDPVVVEDLEPYCVVVDRYDEHAGILRRSVADWQREGRRFLLMRDELAVKEALERGATPLEETEFVAGI